MVKLVVLFLGEDIGVNVVGFKDDCFMLIWNVCSFNIVCFIFFDIDFFIFFNID